MGSGLATTLSQTLMLGLLVAFSLIDSRMRRLALFPLPWAQPILDDGRRLAASYANYLVIDGAVLIPAYGDPADAAAQAVERS